MHIYQQVLYQKAFKVVAVQRSSQDQHIKHSIKQNIYCCQIQTRHTKRRYTMNKNDWEMFIIFFCNMAAVAAILKIVFEHLEEIAMLPWREQREVSQSFVQCFLQRCLRQMTNILFLFPNSKIPRRDLIQKWLSNSRIWFSQHWRPRFWKHK